MKFAHDFKASLATQDFPRHWVDHAIPYSQLKKCLKQVQRELLGLGLDPETLRALLDPDTKSPVALQYSLNSNSESHTLRPKLTVNVHLENGVPVEASLAPASRDFLKRIASDIARGHAEPGTTTAPTSVPSPTGAPDVHDDSTDSSPTTSRPDSPTSEHTSHETIEVPLVFDARFFDMLQTDVTSLDALQSREEVTLSAEIAALGKQVSQVAKPSRWSRSDLARWRHIFELYLDAEVFFGTHEQDHGMRSSQVALKQLQWFQQEVQTRNLAKNFRLEESRVAFTRFLELNSSLLKNLQFQELNKLAITKILKKFDKRTSLGVSKTFPKAVHSGKILAGSMAQDVCAQMSKELVGVVPQINDYLCPICFSVAYMPVRLDCQHVFCIRCIIKIQRRKERHCPLCRADVLLRASSDNLDYELKRYLKKYFREEVKEKQRANEIERGREDFGPSYNQSECRVM